MKHVWLVIFMLVAAIVLTGVGIAGVFFYYVYFDDPNTGGIFMNNSDTGYCNLSLDQYQSPNFVSVRQILGSEEMIRDLPDDGSITLAFYHNFGSCKVYDKIYYITRSSIEEQNVKGDIEITIPSEYARKLVMGNACEVIQNARNNQDLQKTFNLNKAQLVWKYASMYKYKDCLGL